MAYTASSSLTLEQVPGFRGTMMSISLAAMNTGGTLGAGVGGLVLLLYNYEFMGISLGGMGFIGSLAFLFGDRSHQNLVALQWNPISYAYDEVRV